VRRADIDDVALATVLSATLLAYLIGLFVAVTLAYSLAVLKVIPGSEILLKPIAIITGKDTTFTARTQIWEIIRAHIQFSPFVGTGYGGYGRRRCPPRLRSPSSRS